MKTPLVERFGNESRWVNWRLETVEGRPTKVPHAVTGRKASSTDPSTWSNYDSVALASDKVGIIFTPDKQLLGIDLDHFFKDGIFVGDNKEKVADIILEADTYTEISPSGEGFHLFLEVKNPLSLLANKKDMVDSDGVKRGYECYTSGRFFTVTGVPYGEAKDIRIIDVVEANRLLSLIDYPWGRNETNNAIQEASTEELANDEDILDRMFVASNGEAVEKLYNGDISGHDNDDSSADMALCCHLSFWTGRNAKQIERIWLASPIGKREKTQKRKDYRDRTIKNAINKCEDVYEWPKIVSQEVKKGEVEEIIPSTLSLADLMSREFPRARFVLDPFFESGTVNMVSAPPNTWKSWLLFYFSIYISQGLPVLNRFDTEESKIMIVNEEDSYRSVQDRFKALDIKNTNLPIYFRIAKGAKLDEKYVKELLKELKEKDIKTIMFDSLRSIHNADENNSTEMQKVLDLLKMIAREDITVIFTHHHRKKSMFSKGDDAEASRGSSAINAAISGHISLEEEDRDTGKVLIVRHLKSKAREKIPSFEIKIDKSSDGKINFLYDGELKTAEKKIATAKDQILRVFKNGGGYKTVKDFTTLEVAGNSIVRAALKSLESESQIKSMSRKDARAKGISGMFDGKANELVFYVPQTNELEINFD